MSNAPDILQFQCTACGSVLTVPSSMAGVTGPCPVCSQIITSPSPEPMATVQLPQYQPQPPIPIQPVPEMAPPTGSVLPPRRDPLAPFPPPANEPATQASPTLPIPSRTPHVPHIDGGLPNNIMGGAWPPANPAAPHPVLNSLLNGVPPPTPAAAAPMAAPAPFPTSVPQPTVQATKPAVTGKPLPKYDRLPSDTRGRKSVAIIGTLLMGSMVLAGVGWFFKDEIKSKVRIAMAARAEAEPDDSSSLPLPTKESPATKPASSSPALTSPVPPKAEIVPPAPFDPNSPPAKVDVSSPPVTIPFRPPETVMPAHPSTVPPKAKPVDEGLMEVPPANTGTAMIPQAQVNIFVKATPDTQPVVDILKKFFGAQNWQERLKYVQLPEKVKVLMEQYYASNPDGPIVVNHIELLRHDAKPPQGSPHCVFQVGGPGLNVLLPIMVEMNAEGGKVDWLTFTEFKDNLLLKYVQTFQEQPARFHVMIRRAHYFDDDVPALDKRQCFNMAPPMPGFTANAFVEKGSILSQELDRNLGWEVSNAAVIVEIAWRKQDNYQWLELTGVPQYNWRNESAVATAKSATK